MRVRLPLEADGYVLREYRAGDIPRLARLADDYEIWRRLTDVFPRPYDEKAGLRWVMQQAEYDPPRNLVLAGPDGLVGGVGVILADIPNFMHDGEVGYWLGREYWGRGLMTVAVAAFCAWVGPAHGLSRLTARVFAGNEASRRVIERCGFEHEGTQRGAVRKEGEILDLHLYGKVL